VWYVECRLKAKRMAALVSHLHTVFFSKNSLLHALKSRNHILIVSVQAVGNKSYWQ